MQLLLQQSSCMNKFSQIAYSDSRAVAMNKSSLKWAKNLRITCTGTTKYSRHTTAITWTNYLSNEQKTWANNLHRYYKILQTTCNYCYNRAAITWTNYLSNEQKTWVNNLHTGTAKYSTTCNYCYNRAVALHEQIISQMSKNLSNTIHSHYASFFQRVATESSAGFCFLAGLDNQTEIQLRVATGILFQPVRTVTDQIRRIEEKSVRPWGSGVRWLVDGEVREH